MSDAGTRILIVDDEVSFGEMVADILTDQGHSVVYLSDPREAVGRVGVERFDAALLDLVMPGMGGLELAERVKAASPDTEVLILTGQGDIESAIEGIHKGVFDYLQKGTIEVSRLERRVVEAVAKSRLTRENRELVARLRESNRLLKALQDIGTELAGEAFLDRILRRLVDSARELCGAERGRALLFDRTHGEDVLLIAAAAGDGAATVRGARLPLGAGIAPLVAETDQTLQLAERRCATAPSTGP
jgi:PleD family two-component response regulator